MQEEERIVRINIEEEMKTAYIDYSMSVIVSRALPDVRDGMKPVHRRVLFGMNELSLYANKPYKKSARIVGEVLGKYHPHGDSSVYEAMVRMAQTWSLRYPLVDGQGNFGSIDNDSPAAMRYTEARLQKIAEDTLVDLDKNTVDFRLNFDDSMEEPTVLPTKVPTLLINGASGIAVGMATNLPPHNIGNAIDAIVTYIDNRDIDIDSLIEKIVAPDFPTGGTIYGYQGVIDAYHTGRGRIVLRSKTEIEITKLGRERIVVTEIPYLVNKAELIKKIGELVNEKKIDGISYANDESDRKGMRIIIDLKKDAISNVVLAKLFKYTQLQTSFSVNNIALVNGRPKLLNLKEIITHFVNHRHEVIVRRTQFELDAAEKKAHILEGLLIALDNLDAVINLIRSSKTPEEARIGLMNNFELTEAQARAILDLRLQKLTGLERDKIKQEYDEIMKLIAGLKEILADESIQMNIIKTELLEIKEKYNDKRRTEIIYASEDINPEDYYSDDEMVVTISHMGYIKRTLLSEFRTQNRGGVGAKASNTRGEDFLENMFIATNHNTILFFTDSGKCFWLKVYEIPEGTKTSKGRAIQNILNISSDDTVRTFINVKNLNDTEYINNNNIVLCTKKGVIKKTTLEAYSRPRQNGIIAINIKDNDRLIEAKLTNSNQEIMLAIKSGRAIRFNESIVRAIGRNSQGVKGITLAGETDEVIGMVCADIDADQGVLVVSENGFGKRSKISDYRITNRGGKGVKTINVTEKTGNLIAIKGVSDKNDLMIINKSGITIRLSIDNLRVMGRATQGVKLINLREGDSIAAVAVVENTIVENQEVDSDISLSEDASTESNIDSSSLENENLTSESSDE
ncbi:MAG: DNA gyrase subunit A [Bacteroidetes bacterium]|jgi:DNA gyrase subunit A|nr:DNA gyrase subunit A [Bacteroidota bacterium]MBT6685064.1 DNA gyrase subunit A [Bacteroidota bacterium]MBT7144553.1 DNA gyrase subunit A [Bacteroidota bacterium]MBT7491782.1 DNA gyrase subunit A [Bacteroidota bacterium]